MQNCKTCRFWREHFPGVDEADDERLGSCEFRIPTPHAWRYCSREIVGVLASEGGHCPTWQTI